MNQILSQKYLFIMTEIGENFCKMQKLKRLLVLNLLFLGINEFDNVEENKNFLNKNCFKKEESHLLLNHSS